MPLKEQYFLFRFHEVECMEIERVWTFNDVSIIYEQGKQKIRHRNFNVLCKAMSIIQVLNGQDVWEPLPVHYLRAHKRLDSIGTTLQPLISTYPEIQGLQASIFRYDRWENALFLELSENYRRTGFLAFFNCLSFSFSQEFFISHSLMTQPTNSKLRVSELATNFYVVCDFIEVWSKEQFSGYDLALHKSLSDEARYGIRQNILSLKDFNSS